MSTIAFHERCTCWVKDTSEVTQFQIRRGAHAPDCPEYRESLDPVDRAYDRDLRRHGMAGKIR